MTVTIRHGDCREVLKTLPDQSVHMCVTSPPYFGLRDYGHAGQIGLESAPDAYVAEMVAVFAEVRRVLRDDGTLWLNLGDSYAAAAAEKRNNNGTGKTGLKRNVRNEESRQKCLADNKIFRGTIGRVEHGLKPKDLIGIPWRVAFALQADGWYLRQDIIWSKPNPMPESVTDRCTKAHEYIFLMSKSAKYYYDAGSIAEPVSDTSGAKALRKIFDPTKQGKEFAMKEQGIKGGNDGNRNPDATHRNKRSIWEVSTQPFSEAHFATFPPDLIEPCIKAGCPLDGTVLDCFGGAGTTGLVADRLNRNAILIELNQDYAEMAELRIHNDAGLFAEIALDLDQESTGQSVNQWKTQQKPQNNASTASNKG